MHGEARNGKTTLEESLNAWRGKEWENNIRGIVEFMDRQGMGKQH